MVNVPYPYRIQERIALPSSATEELGPTSAVLFNSYRDADKLVTRLLYESVNFPNVQWVKWSVQSPSTSGQILTVALAPTTLVGGNLQVSFAEYTPPYPFTVHPADTLLMTCYTNIQIVGPPPTVQLTSEFQYINRDGVAPDRMYQG